MSLPRKLSQLNRGLEVLFKSAPAAICFIRRVDGHLTYEYANPAYEKLVGRKDLSGQKLFELFPTLKTDDPALAKVLEDAAEKGSRFQATELPVVLDWDNTKTLSTRYLNFSIEPVFDDQGLPEGLTAFAFDITDQVLLRKKVEESKFAVENERENFRNLFRQTPEMVVILSGPEHRFEFVNEAHVKVLGFDATGKTVREAQPESVEVHGILDEVYRTGKTAELHEIPVTVTDRLRYFNLTYAARHDSSGKINGIMILGVEVTNEVHSRRVVQTELSQAQNFAESILENIPNMIFVKDAKDLSFVRLNRAGEDLIGVSRDKLIGKTDFDFFPKEDAIRFQAKDREVLAGNQIIDIPEEEIATAHRGTRLLHTKKLPIKDENGQPRYLVGISEDITERKALDEERLLLAKSNFERQETNRTNERLQFLAESTRKLVSTLELENILKELTVVCVPFLADWCSVELVQADGKLKQLAVAHKDPEKVKWAWELNNKFPPAENSASGAMKVLKTGQGEFLNNITPEMIESAAINNEHLKVLKALGFYSYICIPIKVRSSVIGTLTLVTTAESQRRYQEADMRFAQELADRAGIAVENSRLYKEAKNLNQVKDEFLATLSHELRTPINVIQGHADMLFSDFDQMSESEIRDSIAAIQRNTKLQTQIVSDLLDVSSIITGKVTYVPQTVSPAEVSSFIVNAIKPAAINKGVKIHFEMQDPPQMILADPTRLQQILWNLSNNAVKFTPSGGEVWIRLSGEGDNCVFTVKDTGLGIDPQFLPYVFDRFRQADSSMSRRFGGLGLGLSIVKSLVEIHGGHVTVKSDGLGKGSEFKVELPIKTTYSYSIPSISRKPENQEERPQFSLSGLTILLVEDSPDNRELVARFLQKNGAKVFAAESPAKARELLEKLSPDIILSDIGMPEENGLDFIRRLRRESKERFIPAVALTAYVRPQEIDEALSAGFQGHIAKPVSPASLIKGIAAALERR